MRREHRFQRRLSSETLEHRVLLSADPSLSSWYDLVEVASSSSAGFPGPDRMVDGKVDVPASPDRWIVQLTEAAFEQRSGPHDTHLLFETPGSPGLQITRGLGQRGLLLLESYANEADIEPFLRELEHVDWFERDGLSVGEATPNDSLFAQQNGLEHINAPEAWDLFLDDEQTVGDANVVVGIVDTGIDYAHPDLYLNIWLNQGEIPGELRDGLVDTDDDGLITFYDLNEPVNASFVQDNNGNSYIDARDLLDDPRWANEIDNDQNSLRDDLVGWNFVNNSNDPFDDHAYGHGTHVAGIIGASGQNSRDVAGISWRTSLMPLKALDSTNTGSTGVASSAIDYAKRMRLDQDVNVRVINTSFSGAQDVQSLERSIEASAEADILVIAAAGNGNTFGEGVNIDVLPRYPASYEADNIISVAASDLTGDGLARFSNFGNCDVDASAQTAACSVDLAAPGVNIISTHPTSGIAGDSTDSRNGTSMASPHVAGVAALMFARNPSATTSEVRDSILGSVRKTPLLNDFVGTGGVLDALGALETLQETPTARLLTAPTINSELGVVEINVLYEADAGSGGIDVDTVGDDDLIVTRTGSPDTVLPATLTSACWFLDNGSCLPLPIPGFNAEAEVILASYQVSAPAEFTEIGMDSSWQAIDSGDYVVRLNEDAVANAAGIGNREANLLLLDNRSSFAVDIDDNHVVHVGSESELRREILVANLSGEDVVIVLAAGNYRLDVPGSGNDSAGTGDLDIRSQVTILGAGPDHTVIQQGTADRVFDVHEDGKLTLGRLTVSSGSENQGAGIRNHGDLLLYRSRVTQNEALTGGGIWNAGVAHVLQSTIDSNTIADDGDIGAGIYNAGQLTVERSTISNNTANNNGFLTGGASGAGIFGESGELHVINSTISANRATQRGAGIHVSGGTASLTHTTIANNSSDRSGGGLASSIDATVVIANSVVANNEAPSDPDVYGTIDTRGTNLIGIYEGSDLPAGNLLGTPNRKLDPRLEPLIQYEGEHTATHRLRPDSDAVRVAGPLGFIGTGVDQRGLTRPSDIGGGELVSLGATQKYYSEIRGRLFHDVDGDGKKTLGENSLGGWIVYVDLNENELRDEGEPFTETFDADDPATGGFDESEFVISGLDPMAENIIVRTESRFGYVDSTPVTVSLPEAQVDVPLRRVVTPTEDLIPYFHLDFSQPTDQLTDVSGAAIPIQVGDSVITRTPEGDVIPGPQLANGEQLYAGQWLGTNDGSNAIIIDTHDALADVSRTAGSVVTWINVDNDAEWNSIFVTDCWTDSDDCHGLTRHRGMEFNVDPRSGAFGSVQGFHTNNFGPAHATSGGEGGSESPSGVWTHVALTWNDAGDHTVFVNGVPGKTVMGVGPDEPFGLNEITRWNIGGTEILGFPEDDPNGRRLSGKLSDFAIFNAELDEQAIDNIIRAGVPIIVDKVFHLDFADPEIADVSEQQMPLRVGHLIQTVESGGPQLENGVQLDSARWLDYDHDENHIDILDNSVLDEVSRSSGSIVTWVKVENDDDWNNILKTQCPDLDVVCPAWSETRGIELQTDRSHTGAVWGAVQGWASQSLGPIRDVQSAGGTETPSDVWTHIALTWNANGDHTTYVNGVPGRRIQGVGIDEFGLNDTGDWSIGGDRTQNLHGLIGDENGRRLHGELADFAIFNGELDREGINDIMRFGVIRTVQPVFHLDFEGSVTDLADVSASGIPVTVGSSVTTIDQGGPLLNSGRVLPAGRWSGANDNSNAIIVHDNPILDDISRSQGSVVTWVRVEDDSELNGILLTACEDDAENLILCNEYGPNRGIELRANSASGTFGAVQGYNTNAFGPQHGANGGPGGTETPSGVWTHVAMTWNDRGDHTLYVNGYGGVTVEGVGLEPFGQNDVGDWLIGGDNVVIDTEPNGWKLRGELADFAIFDTQLSDREIQSILQFGVDSGGNGAEQQSIRSLSRFDPEPSVVGNRIIFEDHLGRVQAIEGNGESRPLVGLNTVTSQVQPLADGRSISYDGEFVAFSGEIAENLDSSDSVRGIFLVNQFGGVENLVDENSDVPLRNAEYPDGESNSFKNRKFVVHAIADRLTVFGVTEPDEIIASTGRVVRRGVNEQGIYVASQDGRLVALIDRSGPAVPGTNSNFETFGAADFDGRAVIFQGTHSDGFGIYKVDQNGDSLEMLVDDSTTLPDGSPLVGIGNYAFHNGQLVFHGISETGQGIYSINSDGSWRTIADTNTLIPGDRSNFRSFQDISLDNGSVVFVGRGIGAEEALKSDQKQQLGVYVYIDGRLESVVAIQSEEPGSVFGDRQPVSVSIGREAISGSRVVFHAAFNDGSDGIFSIEFGSTSQHEVPLTPGSVHENLNFGRIPSPGGIRGTVFNDIDGNRQRDEFELGVAGWTVFLDLDAPGESGFGQLDADEPSTRSGATGEYEFTNLPTLQSYSVQLVPQNEWSVVPTDVFNDDVMLDASETRSDLDFAVRQSLIIGNCLGGVTGVCEGEVNVLVFSDNNGDGIRDGNEPAIAGRTVYVDVNRDGAWSPNEDIVADFTNGLYRFTDLSLGQEYEIFLLQEDGSEQTGPLQISPTPVRAPIVIENIGLSPSSVITGSWDNDDAVDLLIADYETNSLSMVSNVGGFQTRRRLEEYNEIGPVNLASVDLNGDGREDLAVANYDSSSVSILLSNGDGSFEASKVTLGDKTGPLNIAIINANGDDAPDLAVVNSLINAITILENDGFGQFIATQSVSLEASPISISTADFNGDELDDIAVTLANKTVQIVLGDNDGFLPGSSSATINGFPISMATGDFDGDDKPDVAIANGQFVTILPGDGDGGFTESNPIPLDSFPLAITVADVDGDNDLDIVLSKASEVDTVVILRNDGNSTFFSTTLGGDAALPDSVASPRSVTTADVTNDGIPDFVLADFYTDTVTVIENTRQIGSYNVRLYSNEQDAAEEPEALNIAFAVRRLQPDSLPGDANRDGVVDFVDFLALSKYFNQQDVGWEQGDFDGDGLVGFGDFLVLSGNFAAS